MRLLGITLPSGAMLWSGVALVATTVIGVVIALVRRDARLDERSQARLKDFEKAKNMRDRVVDGRVRRAAGGLRRFEDRGYRD